jgi:putative aminopeptidase FrvX
VSVPELLGQLLTAPGPSGQETLAAEVWREAAGSFGDVETDVLGSSWVRVPGTAGGPSLAIVGHIDEIGAVVTHAGDDGLVALRAIGGLNPHVLLGQRVEVLTRAGRIHGVVAARKRKPGSDAQKALEQSDLVLDLGAKDGEEARSLVRPGDAAVIASAPLELRNGRVAARSLDNRIGCYVALEVARRVAADGGAPGDVVGIAAVQEEVGDFAGSRTTAFAVEPDIAIAVDVTHATDVRGGDPEEDGEHKLGSGPALMRGPALHPAVFELLYETAEAEKIPCTVEVTPGHTSTDADAVYLSRRGVATGLVSVPLRYMHSPIELVQLDDIEAAIRLLFAFAGRLSRERPALAPR